MTRSVILARLRAAGLEPALFDDAALSRIAEAVVDLPSVSAPTVPTVSALSPPNKLYGEIRAAAQRCLDAPGANALLLAFGGEAAYAAVVEACTALGDALPRWREEAAHWFAQSEAVCRAAEEALAEGYCTARELACLHAAAQITHSPDAEKYLAVLITHEAGLERLEHLPTEVHRAALALNALFDEHIPVLLDAAAPLFDGETGAFSLAAFRIAALRLRENCCV